MDVQLCDFQSEEKKLPDFLTLSGPEGGWDKGAGGAECTRAHFNLRELPCYLSNTYETLPFLLKFIGEQDSGKSFCQDAMFTEILTFLIFFSFN